MVAQVCSNQIMVIQLSLVLVLVLVTQLSLVLVLVLVIQLSLPLEPLSTQALGFQLELLIAQSLLILMKQHQQPMTLKPHSLVKSHSISLHQQQPQALIVEWPPQIWHLSQPQTYLQQARFPQLHRMLFREQRTLLFQLTREQLVLASPIPFVLLKPFLFLDAEEYFLRQKMPRLL